MFRREARKGIDRAGPARLVLVSAILLSLSGCGGDDDGGSNPTPTLIVSTATATPTGTAVPTPVATATATSSATSTPEPSATSTATPTASATPSATATATPDLSDVAAFAGVGPYAVGVTTLDLQDREVEVWYPLDPGTEAGSQKASYASFEVLPQAIIDLLPPHLNIVVEMDAYRDLPASQAGPFPVFTFSHGAGGFRHAYSGFLVGIASHGFVVVSIDHLEWGLLAQVGLLPPGIDRTAGDVLLETLARLSAASADPKSPLAGGVDASQVATAGHSAGGRAAFAFPDRQEVRAMLGYATGSAENLVTAKPVLLMVGAEDAGAARLEQTYDKLTPVKRFVSVDAVGHNSFTDQCAIIHGGNNFLLDLVKAGFPIPQNLLDLAIDGCRPENLAPAEFWKVAQHFTVAQLRSAFAQGDPRVGLGDGVASAFAGITMRYRQDDGPVPAPLGFVVSGFRSIVPQHDVDPCPNGFNKGPVERAAAGLDPIPDDCDHPEASVDPDYQTIEAPGTVDGVDLDGVDSQNAGAPEDPCGHADFAGLGGELGLDLQLWRAVGCVRGFQEGEITDTVVNQAVRDGSMTILLELYGVDDPQNDDFVRLRVFASTDSPPMGADGSVLPFGTLSVHENPSYHSTVAEGEIVGGVLTAGPIDIRLRLNIQIVIGDFSFEDGIVRMQLNPDGTASGSLFGFQPIEEFYDRIGRQTGQAGTSAIGFTCTGLYAALVDKADGGYDSETRQCTSLSVGYGFQAVPAFVAR